MVKFTREPRVQAEQPFTIAVDSQQSMLGFNAAINDECPAVQRQRRNLRAKGNRIDTVVQTVTDLQHYRGKEGYVIGFETVNGTALITLNLNEVRGLVWRAARNKSRKAIDGPVTVRFAGTKIFTPQG